MMRPRSNLLVGFVSVVSAFVIGGCDSGHSSGSKTENGDDSPIDPAPALKTFFAGMQLATSAPSVGFIAPDGDQNVALTTPVVVVFSESMDASTVNATSFSLTETGSSGGGGPGGGPGIPGLGFSGGSGGSGGSSGTGGTGDGGDRGVVGKKGHYKPSAQPLFGPDRNGDGVPDDSNGDGIPDDFDGDGLPDDGGDPGSGGDPGGEPGITPGTPVAGSIVADPECRQRAFLFIPTSPLKASSDFTVRLSTAITDAEGKPLEAESDAGDDVAGALQGVAVERSFSSIDDDADSIFRVIGMYPRPDDTNVPLDTVVKIYVNMPVDATVTAGSPFQVLINGVPSSDVAFKVDRISIPGVGTLAVRFKGKVPFPSNALVKIVMKDIAKAANGKRLNDGQGDFSASFRTTGVRTPISIVFPEALPILVDGIDYTGSVSSSNAAAFQSDVTLDSVGDANTITLIYFQGGAVGGVPLARTFTASAGATVASFLSDLAGGAGGSVFAQTNSQVPALPVLVGAFATLDGMNSPVGPVELPDLFVETTKPDVEFGPPSPGNKLALATTLSRPAFYGTASEPLKSLRIDLGTQSTPISYTGLKLGDESEITDASDFFITDEGASLLPGAPLVSGPQYLPIPIDHVTAEDRFGNRTEKKTGEAGELRQEGSIGGALEDGASVQLRVRVVDVDSLVPLEAAVVQIAKHPYDPLGVAPLSKKTNAKGEARFTGGEIASLGPTISVTASDKGRDVYSVVGVSSPVSAGPFGISLPLRKSGDPGAAVSATGTLNIPIAGTSTDAFFAVAGNGAAPATVQSAGDSRFAIAPLAVPIGNLVVARQRPVILAALEHDGARTYVPKSTPIQVFTSNGAVPISFAGAGGPDLPISSTYANTVISIPEIESTGITPGLGPGGYLPLTHGRLVARLPGIPDVFPLSFTPKSFHPPGPNQPPSDPSLRVVFAPIPHTLWVNESAGDPAYERILQPDSGALGVPPSDELLESVFRFEVEVAEELSPGGVQRTRQTAHLDFQHLVTAATDEPLDLPTIPVFTITPSVHPPKLTGVVHDSVVADSLLRVTVRSASSNREWILVVDAASVAAALDEFQLPPSPVNPFSDPGVYRVRVEVVEFDAGEFSIDHLVLSDIEREQHRSARSAESTGDTTPP